MTRRGFSVISPQAAWCVAIVVGGLVLVPAAWGWVHAAQDARTQTQRLARITASTRELAELQACLPEWTLLPKTTSSLAPQVSAVLAAAGLPASTMASLSADSAAPPSPGTDAASVQVRARRASLVLTSLTLPQLGSFMQAWREREPGWVIAQIDLAPETGAAAKTQSKSDTGGDLPLRAILTLETLSLERGGAR